MDDVSRETEDTPIARAAETAVRVLAGRVGEPLPRPPHPRADGGQPEGRRRQDDHDREPGRGPGAAGRDGAGRRPGPAGQRLDRPGRRPPRRGALGLRRAGRRPAAHEVVDAGRGDPRPLVRAGDDRPGRRRDRAGARWWPASRGWQRRSRRYLLVHRAGAADAAAGLRAHRLPAEPGPAHRQRVGGRAARCSSRSSASTTPWRGSASC